MKKNKFVLLCREGKGSVPYAEYLNSLLGETKFIDMVTYIHENGLVLESKTRVSKKMVTTDGSEKAERWRDFFRDNSFDSTNQMRLFAEAIAILEGIDTLPFLRISKAKSGNSTFPEYVCIIPMRNENSHNYKIGEPVLSIERGTSFYRSTGSCGNSMSTDINDYRMANPDEISDCLSMIMFKNSELARYIATGLVPDDDE